jgi:hypothetical protein
VITRFEDLVGVPDGQRVEVEGRYEAYAQFPAPPGPPRTARVVLGGGGVLVGGYLDPESVRPAEEIERLDGAIVRIAGRFLRTREWPNPDAPMPGIWTGGGPQLVDVDTPRVVTPAPPRAAAPPVEAAPPPAKPPRAPAARPMIPAHVGRLARRSLAFGTSRLAQAAIVVVALAAGAAALLFEYAVLGLRDETMALAPIVAIGLALYAAEKAIVRSLSSRELRRLSALPWGFDLGAYVALLDREQLFPSLRVEVELEEPDTAPASVFTSPVMATEEWSFGHRPTTTPTNAGLHRWLRRCVKRELVPLHAHKPIRAIVVRV